MQYPFVKNFLDKILYAQLHNILAPHSKPHTDSIHRAYILLVTLWKLGIENKEK